MTDDKVSFTLRLPKDLHDRLIGICGATTCEVTRSGLIIQATEMFLSSVDLYPSLIPDYDPKKDKYARQRGRASCAGKKGMTDGEK